MTPQPQQEELWMIGWSSVERASILKRRRQARAAIDQREYGKAPLPPSPPSWDGLEPFDDGFEEEVAKLAPKPDSLETENASQRGQRPELLTPHPVTDRDAIAQALIREMSKSEAGEGTPSLPTDGLTPDEKAAVEAGDVLQAKPSKKAFHAWLDAALRATGCDTNVPEVPNAVDVEVGGRVFRLQVSMPRKK